ncbi:MAG: hypothetical protein AAB423_03625 [Patescibacteria group bacterium]
MLKNILPFIKYPYATGLISIVWIGTAMLYYIDKDLPITLMIAVNCVVTIIILNNSMK